MIRIQSASIGLPESALECKAGDAQEHRRHDHRSAHIRRQPTLMLCDAFAMVALERRDRRQRLDRRVRPPPLLERLPKPPSPRVYLQQRSIELPSMTAGDSPPPPLEFGALRWPKRGQPPLLTRRPLRAGADHFEILDGLAEVGATDATSVGLSPPEVCHEPVHGLPVGFEFALEADGFSIGDA